MIFTSPFPDITVPSLSLHQFALQGAVDSPETVILLDGSNGAKMSFGELEDRVRGTALGLWEWGFRQSDVFAIFCPNSPQFAVAFLSVSRLGGIVTTVNPLYTSDELAHQLEDSRAKCLLTIPVFLEKAKEAARKTGIQEVFVLGDAAGATPFDSLYRPQGEAPPVTINPLEDIVALPYSSGTTGLPKGVMLTHHNIVANVLQYAETSAISSRDKLLAVLPFFHIYGLVIILLAGLYRRVPMVTMPRFEFELFLQLMEKHGITRVHLVPPILLALAKDPLVEKYDLSRLKTIYCGAAPLPTSIGSACEERLNCLVVQGYGMAEASPLTHVNPDDCEHRILASAGAVVPNTECKIVDDLTQKELGCDENGEVWVRGPQVMKGYLNQPEASANTLDAEGWLHTGDIGHMSENGFLFIVDRLKELIKYKGMQIAPAELEAVLLTHPAIADAAVVPVDDEEAGEIPKGYIVLKKDVPTEDILRFVAERVAPYKKLRLLEAIDAIPKSATGKILRRVLKDRDKNGTVS